MLVGRFSSNFGCRFVVLADETFYDDFPPYYLTHLLYKSTFIAALLPNIPSEVQPQRPSNTLWIVDLPETHDPHRQHGALVTEEAREPAK